MPNEAAVTREFFERSMRGESMTVVEVDDDGNELGEPQPSQAGAMRRHLN
jgi:hypothetical protein